MLLSVVRSDAWRLLGALAVVAGALALALELWQRLAPPATELTVF